MKASLPRLILNKQLQDLITLRMSLRKQLLSVQSLDGRRVLQTQISAVSKDIDRCKQRLRETASAP